MCALLLILIQYFIKSTKWIKNTKYLY